MTTTALGGATPLMCCECMCKATVMCACPACGGPLVDGKFAGVFTACDTDRATVTAQHVAERGTPPVWVPA